MLRYVQIGKAVAYPESHTERGQTMVTAQTVKGLAQRLEKAQVLVDDGAVFAVAGVAGYAVVRNGDGSQMYLVEYGAGRERCSCPDYQQRQKMAGLPCKHIIAAQLALGDRPQASAPAAVPVEDPATADDPEWMRQGRPDPAVGIAILTGQPRRAA